MDRKKFAMIKYDHSVPMSLSGAPWIWLLLVVAVAVGALFVFIPLRFILGIVALVLIRQPKRLYVGPRYLI
ncbi:hypothetical protein [Cystobacter fuscus]|uniref:hypothetical protein n=1 Tax=Cystobacter fuscus TaxID=43 RepID=UPI002B2D4BD4|nr:hypothetical protein F0U63_29530 [Cystobacter fuscus]